jgi:hypothetical protein
MKPMRDKALATQYTRRVAGQQASRKTRCRPAGKVPVAAAAQEDEEEETILGLEWWVVKVPSPQAIPERISPAIL